MSGPDALPPADRARDPVAILASQLPPHADTRDPVELVAWLARTLAHDVGNVLTAIAGYAELIETDLDRCDPHLADAVGIRDAALRAGGLLRQLLMVGRRRSVRIETIDASALVSGLAPLLGSATGDRVRLVITPSHEPAIIRADRSSLELALLNLAVNARDAMPDGGTVTVAVTTAGAAVSAAATGSDLANTPDLLAAEEVCITVEDTGVGIDASTLPRIFEPFFSTKAEHGSGIGLAAVDEAAAVSSGTVTVESRRGEGTRFTIHLPRALGTPAVESLPGGSPAPHLRAHGTALVVEPSAEVRLVVARLLERLGLEVVDASTARQAEALAGHGLDRLDLLVTASTLPDLSAADLTRRIRARYPQVPVLALAETPVANERAVPTGDGITLLKPVTMSALERAIAMLLPQMVGERTT